ncbi:hypothetical protein [Symbiobacterium thermophilum]|uniref:Uncharacterized protein n=1 Tax=Symbiobacterium thermophilum TaxID=2734 RepID=A0A953LFV5_SYMTR|nr:hypothetical protein [Symbiobacterium thermophilum]MBY6275603.1 hypothetical protein [Symbiobacterium thermophilum]
MGILDQITGKAIAQQVTEYSEIYGEILIGLHRDVEHLRDDVDRAQQALARAEQKIERLDQQPPAWTGSTTRCAARSSRRLPSSRAWPGAWRARRPNWFPFAPPSPD